MHDKSFTFLYKKIQFILNKIGINNFKILNSGQNNGFIIVT